MKFRFTPDKQAQFHFLWIVLISALLVLLAAVLLAETLYSFSNPAVDLDISAETGKPPVVVPPVEPISKQEPEAEPSYQAGAPPLTAEEYEAALAKWDIVYCDSQVLQHGYVTANDMVELDGRLYFFASEIGSDGTERTGLAASDLQHGTMEWLVSPTNELVLENLQEQNGALYVTAWEQPERQTLLAFSKDGNMPDLLYTGAFWTYQVYGGMVFLQTEDGLWALPLDKAAVPLCLWNNTERIELRSFCATEAGVVVQLAPAHWKEGLHRLYLLHPEGGHTLLFEGSGTISWLTSVGETVYFLYRETVNTTSELRLAAVSCQGGSPGFTSLPRQRKEPTAYLSSMFASGDTLFFHYRRDDHDCLEFYVTDLQGHILEQYIYDNSDGTLLLDTVTAKAMLGQSTLYLQGKSFSNGTKTTTQIQRAPHSDCTGESCLAAVPDAGSASPSTPEQVVAQLEETFPLWSPLFQEPFGASEERPNEYMTAGDSGAAYLAWYDDMEKPIIIRNTDDTATTLYTSHDLRPIRSILEWQDNLYFELNRKDNRYYDLYRVPVSGGAPELLYEQLSSFTSSAPYCIIGKHAYLITATEQLLAISLDAPEEPVLLLDTKQRCEIISLFPADHGLVLQVKCAHKTGDLWCWLYLSAKGITLLDVIDEDDFLLRSYVGGNLGLYQKVRTDKTVDIYRVDTTTGSRGDLIVSFPSKSDLLIVVVSIIEETATIRTEGFDESGLRWEAFYALNLTTGEIRELLYYPYVGTHNVSPTRLFQIQQCGNDLYLLGYHQIYHITRYRDIYSGAAPVEEGFDDQQLKWVALDSN